jgi:hypothetical protein
LNASIVLHVKLEASREGLPDFGWCPSTVEMASDEASSLQGDHVGKTRSRLAGGFRNFDEAKHLC